MSNILCFLHGWTKTIPIVSKERNNDVPGKHSILDSDYYEILMFDCFQIEMKIHKFTYLCDLYNLFYLGRIYESNFSFFLNIIFINIIFILSFSYLIPTFFISYQYEMFYCVFTSFIILSSLFS